MEKLANILKEVRFLGYTMVSLHFTSDMPEYDLFSNEVNQDFHRMLEVRKQKMLAMEKGEYENAADFRDQERILLARIKAGIPECERDNFFIVAGRHSELILFNHPESSLIPLFIKDCVIEVPLQPVDQDRGSRSTEIFH